MKQKIDMFSYQCGVIDAFNEVVGAGVKQLALSHPVKQMNEIEVLIPFVEETCKQYHTNYYIEDEFIITDLFPSFANKNTYVILFYKDEKILATYLDLKKTKQNCIHDNTYEVHREEIALSLGVLLSYSLEACKEKIRLNTEKEIF